MLLVLCEGNSSVTGEPPQRASNAEKFPCDDVIAYSITSLPIRLADNRPNVSEISIKTRKITIQRNIFEYFCQVLIFLFSSVCIWDDCKASYKCNCLSNHMPGKVWDEITYPFPNFNGCTVEVGDWISNVIAHIIMDDITYPCCLMDPNFAITVPADDQAPFSTRSVMITLTHCGLATPYGDIHLGQHWSR